PSRHFHALPPPTATLCPYTTLFRSCPEERCDDDEPGAQLPQVVGHAGLRGERGFAVGERMAKGDSGAKYPGAALPPTAKVGDGSDRKSTRLNSSHVKSSYAVFCLKK